MAELGQRDDVWREDQTLFGDGQPVNNHFKWFPVLGHEMTHLGQIRRLRARAIADRHLDLGNEEPR